MRKTVFSLWLIICLPLCLFAQYFDTPQLLFPYTSKAPEIISQAAVLIDTQTGALLYSKNPNQEIPPASLTKLMTLHLLMNEIDEGRASYDKIVPITVESWAQSQPAGSSLMFLEPGQIVTLREIMLGLAVSSGNDAAVAAALCLAPNMRDFAALMTAEARRMGLKVTRFVESSGISENNMTTAIEFAYFCSQYITLHPQSIMDFHSVTVFSYPMAANIPVSSGKKTYTITQYNRNPLLNTFYGVDGLKTGYIDESGYNIALTARRNQTRFIAVLLGAPARPGGERIREADSIRLLSWAFDNFKTVRPNIGKIENPRLWKGKENSVEIKPASSPDFTSPMNRASTLLFETRIEEPLIAPLPADFTVGFMIVSDEYGELNRVPLVTVKSCEKGNIFKRIWHSILLLFY
jgi:D-alanyl-D-alanine carboxypeptidase (penicillin-binding protein 5/6)